MFLIQQGGYKNNWVLISIFSLAISGCVVTENQSAGGGGYSAFGGTKKGANDVRTQETSSEGCRPVMHLIDNGDGTITDSTNGVIWQRCRNGENWRSGRCSGQAKTTTYTEALKLAKSNRFLGEKDWRLPTVGEFVSLGGAPDGKRCDHENTYKYFPSETYSEKDTEFWTTDATPKDPNIRAAFKTTPWSTMATDLKMIYRQNNTWRVNFRQVTLNCIGVSCGSFSSDYVFVRGGSRLAFEKELSLINAREQSEKKISIEIKQKIIEREQMVREREVRKSASSSHRTGAFEFYAGSPKRSYGATHWDGRCIEGGRGGVFENDAQPNIFCWNGYDFDGASSGCRPGIGPDQAMRKACGG